MRRGVVPLTVLLAALTVSTGSAAHTNTAFACRLATVHYGQPTGAGAIGFSGKTPPWVGSSHLIGFLFFYGQAPFSKSQTRRAYIGTGGHVKKGSTKILWWVRPGTTRSSIAVIGHRLDAGGSFRAVFPAAGPNTFPSIVDVPTPGCWRISVTPGANGGKAAGSLVFRAMNAP